MIKRTQKQKTERHQPPDTPKNGIDESVVAIDSARYLESIIQNTRLPDPNSLPRAQTKPRNNNDPKNQMVVEVY